ncbi:MAG: hypothetical protein MZV65_46075 [Chromatiales bacterium]|nr:hypothetical protein [Chromatiales bacterium]
MAERGLAKVLQLQTKGGFTAIEAEELRKDMDVWMRMYAKAAAQDSRMMVEKFSARQVAVADGLVQNRMAKTEQPVTVIGTGSAKSTTGEAVRGRSARIESLSLSRNASNCASSIKRLKRDARTATGGFRACVLTKTLKQSRRVMR